VEALVSCNKTAAWVWVTSSGLDLTDGTVFAESPVEVRLRAVDVDGLDIKFTRAEIFLNLTDANERVSKFPFNTEIGSNAYTTVVAGAWTKEPGRYSLVVWVPEGPTGSCEILRRSITVTADTTQLIVALVLVGVLLGVLPALQESRARDEFSALLFVVRSDDRSGHCVGNVGLCRYAECATSRWVGYAAWGMCMRLRRRCFVLRGG
jgi:hypothetical protein